MQQLFYYKNATEIYYKMHQIFYYKMQQLFQIATVFLQNATTVLTKCNVNYKLWQHNVLVIS